MGLAWMGFEVFFGFLGVPQHVQKTAFFLDWLQASGPNLTRLGTPKIGPGKIILGIFGVFFFGTRFQTVFS